MTWKEDIAAAKARLAVEHVASVRRLRVEGMSHGAWMLFEYDHDGYLEVVEVSKNIQYINFGPSPGSAEINAAWEVAVETAPRSPSHVFERFPPGTVLAVRRCESPTHDRCSITRYLGSWIEVTFEDGDERAIPIEHLRSGVYDIVTTIQ